MQQALVAREAKVAAAAAARAGRAVHGDPRATGCGAGVGRQRILDARQQPRRLQPLLRLRAMTLTVGEDHPSPRLRHLSSPRVPQTRR